MKTKARGQMQPFAQADVDAIRGKLAAIANTRDAALFERLHYSHVCINDRTRDPEISSDKPGLQDTKIGLRGNLSRD